MINNQLELNVKAKGVSQARKHFEELSGSVQKTTESFDKLLISLNPVSDKLRELRKDLTSIKKMPSFEFKQKGLDEIIKKLEKIKSLKGGSGTSLGGDKMPNLGSAKDSLEGAASGFTSLTKSAGLAGGAVGASIGVLAGVAGAAYAAGSSVISLTQNLMELSQQGGALKSLELSFYRMGQGTQQISELRRAVGGAVSDIDLMKAANKAALFDIPKAEIPKLVKLAVGASAMMGTDLGQAIDDVFTGVGRKSMEIADNMGILISVGEANDKMAKKLGKSVTDLTSQEKTMAFAQEMVAKGSRQMANADMALQEQSGSAIAQLTNFWNDLKISIYEAARESGIFATVMAGVGSGSSPIKSLVVSLVKDFAPILQFTISKIPHLVQLIKDVISDFKEVYEFFNTDTSAKGIEKRTKEFNAKQEAKKPVLYQTEMAELIALKKARNEAFGETIYQTKLLAYGYKDSDVKIPLFDNLKLGFQDLSKEIDYNTQRFTAFGDLVGASTDLNKVIQSFDWQNEGVNVGAAALAASSAFRSAMEAGKGSEEAFAAAGQAIANLAGLTGLTNDGFLTLGKAGMQAGTSIKTGMILTQTSFKKNSEGLSQLNSALEEVVTKTEAIKQARLQSSGLKTLSEEYSLSGILFTDKEFENTMMYILETHSAFKGLTEEGKKEVIAFLTETTAEQKKAKEAQTLNVIRSIQDQQSYMQEDLDFAAQLMYTDLGLAGETEEERLKIIKNSYDTWYQARLAFHKGNEELARQDMSSMNNLFNKVIELAKGPKKETKSGAKVDKLTPLLQRAELVGKTDYQKKIIEADRQFVKDLADAGKSIEGQRAARVLRSQAYISAIKEVAKQELSALGDLTKGVLEKSRAYAQALEERMGIMKTAQKELADLANKEGKFAFRTDTGYVTRQKSDREIAIEQELQSLRDEWATRKQILQEGSDAYIAAQQSFNQRTAALRAEQKEETSTQNLNKELEDFFGPLQSFQAAFSSISGTYQDLISEGTLAEQQTAQAIGGLLSLADATVGMQEEIKKTQQAVIEGKMAQNEADIQNATTGLSVGIKAAKMFFKNKQAEYFLEGMGESAKAAGQFALGNVPGGIAHGLAATLFFKAAARGGGGGQAKQAPARRSAAGSDRSSTAGDSRRALNQVNIFINPITGQAMVNEMNKEGNRREGTKIASRLISTTPRRSDM